MLMKIVLFLIVFSCSSNQANHSGSFGWKQIAEFEYTYLEGETLSSFILPMPGVNNHASRAGFHYRYVISPMGLVNCDPSLQNKTFIQKNENKQDIIDIQFQSLYTEVECFINKDNPNQTIQIKLEVSSDLASTDFYKLYAHHFSHDDGKSRNEKISDFMEDLDEINFKDLAYYLTLPDQKVEFSAKNPDNKISIPKNRPGNYFFLVNNVEYSESLNPYMADHILVGKNFSPTFHGKKLKPVLTCTEKNKQIFKSDIYESFFDHDFTDAISCHFKIENLDHKNLHMNDKIILHYTLVHHTDLKNIIEAEMKNMDTLVTKRLVENENNFKKILNQKMDDKIKKNTSRNNILKSLSDVFEREKKLYIEKMGFGIHYEPLIRAERKRGEMKHFLTLKPHLYFLMKNGNSITAIPTKWDSFNLNSNVEIKKNQELQKYEKDITLNSMGVLQFFKQGKQKSIINAQDLKDDFVPSNPSSIQEELLLKLVSGGKCYTRIPHSNKHLSTTYYGAHSLFASFDKGMIHDRHLAVSPFFHTKNIEKEFQSTLENQPAPRICWPVPIDELVEEHQH